MGDSESKLASEMGNVPTKAPESGRTTSLPLSQRPP